jgi:hypothetical protein
VWTHDGQTVKQCTIACDVWEWEFILVVMEAMIDRRERPAIETIIIIIIIIIIITF